MAILSASLARQFWGDQDPIGRRIKSGSLDSQGPWLTVVGVVGDVHHNGLDEEPTPIWYRPTYAAPWSSSTIVARTELAAETSARLIGEAVRRIDPLQPVFGVSLYDDVVADSYAEERFNAILFAIFAALALSLAGVGVYGLIGYSVSQRTREIGLRVALGAQRRDILAMVLGQGMSLALVGVGAGLLGALGLTRFLAAMLYGISPRDTLTFGLVGGFILITALWASVVPAHRATRVDPLVALHYE